MKDYLAELLSQKLREHCRACWLTADSRWAHPISASIRKALHRSLLEITKSCRELLAGIYVLWYKSSHKKGTSVNTILCIQTLGKPATNIHWYFICNSITESWHLWFKLFIHQYHLFSNRGLFNLQSFVPPFTFSESELNPTMNFNLPYHNFILQ